MTGQDLLAVARQGLARIERIWALGGYTHEEAADFVFEIGYEHFEILDMLVRDGDPVGRIAALIPVGEDESHSCGLDREAVLGLFLGSAMARAGVDQSRDDQLRTAFGLRVSALDAHRRIIVVDMLVTSRAAGVLGSEIAANVVDDYANQVSPEALQQCCLVQIQNAAHSGDPDRAWECLRVAPDPLSIARRLVEADHDRGVVGSSAEFYRWALSQEVNPPPAAEQMVYLLMIGDEDRARFLLDEAIADRGKRDLDYDWLLALAAEVIGAPKIARALAAESAEPTSAELWLLAQDEADPRRRLDVLQQALRVGGVGSWRDLRVALGIAEAVIAAGGDPYAATYFLAAAEVARSTPVLSQFSRWDSWHYHRRADPGDRLGPVLDRRLISAADIAEARSALAVLRGEAGLAPPTEEEIHDLMVNRRRIEEAWLKAEPTSTLTLAGADRAGWSRTDGRRPWGNGSQSDNLKE